MKLAKIKRNLRRHSPKIFFAASVVAAGVAIIYYRKAIATNIDLDAAFVISQAEAKKLLSENSTIIVVTDLGDFEVSSILS